MLEVKKIKKVYETEMVKQTALNGVNLNFRKNEFVAILGSSGSGKTTFLNIIGGLDKYTSGDLIINGKSTKKFKDKDWDSYRNNSIGFVFQSYNLIPHISVLANVEMGMTLSGVSKSVRKRKALKVLDRVGLKEHCYKKPNQLSGGQMQRVAIARALANDPDIILADEPTGALDSKTSIQIMELIKEIAKDKLVIMVTHNPDLAKKYADRIIGFSDGKVISDSNPYKKINEENDYNFKKTAMSFFTALNLSFNNIRTKKGRTLLTAFASSIGIIGIALILSLSNGFDIQIDEFEKDTLSSLPIMISEQSMQMDEDVMTQMYEEMNEDDTYIDDDVIYPVIPTNELMVHTNKLTQDYIDYVENIDNDLVSGISYTRITNLNILSKVDGNYKPLGLSSYDFVDIPRKVNDSFDDKSILDNYDLLYGELPKRKEDLLLIVDNKNRISTNILKAFDLDGKESFKFEDAVGHELKLILNDDYYKELGGYFTINNDLEQLYNLDSAITLRISGIIRVKEDKSLLVVSTSGLSYTNQLVSYVIEENSKSAIVEKQKNSSYNVLTGEKFSDDDIGKKNKDNLLMVLGANSVPSAIGIYPKDFDAKEAILNYLDKFNDNKENVNKVLYTDYGKTISSLSGNIMDAITIVLVAFSAISLVVSCIMIGIITYISVLERTKEIGVLRALGARKKDVRRVFNAETFIIGIASGVLGIFIARLLIIPANIILENMTDLPNVARMNPMHAIILIVISLVLTLIGGAIPARIAAKKDPVIALRTE